MSTAFDSRLWRAERRLWLPPLLLFVVTAGLLFFYRGAYSGRLAALDRTLASEREQFSEINARRESLERSLERVRSNDQGITRLYQEVFATERERLTTFMREVRTLAERAGLERGAISYPEQVLDDQGLVRKSLVFNAVGDYQQLRQFINLLEVTPSFIVVERISVSDADGLLEVQLDLSTLFVADGAGQAPARTGGGG